VALLALFLALGGSSYAATAKLLPRNSVGSKQVIDHSLLAKDFKRGQVPVGARGARGAVGAAGASGPPGATGASSGSIPVAIATNEAAAPASTDVEASFDVTTAFGARLFVRAHVASFALGCTPGPSCAATLALYVDGTQVAGSALDVAVPGPEVHGASLFGVTGPVSVGHHVVTIREKPTSGASTGSLGTAMFTVLELG
jgi:hypothetical protein